MSRFLIQLYLQKTLLPNKSHLQVPGIRVWTYLFGYVIQPATVNMGQYYYWLVVFSCSSVRPDPSFLPCDGEVWSGVLNQFPGSSSSPLALLSQAGVGSMFQFHKSEKNSTVSPKTPAGSPLSMLMVPYA